MRFQVLGIGDAFSGRHYNTSFLLESEHRYLIDAPQAPFRMFRDRGLAAETIDRVILTHIHNDHSSGVESFLVWNRSHTHRPVELLTTEAVFETFKEAVYPRFRKRFSPDLHRIEETSMEDYFQYRELSLDEPNQLESNLWLEVRKNWHPTPTLGLKFGGKSWSMAVSGDTCYRPDLLKSLQDKGFLNEDEYQKLAGGWLWDADLIYHEAAHGKGTAHTLESDLQLLPLEIREKIRLVHVVDDFVSTELPVATEGETVTLESSGQLRINPPTAESV